MEEQKISLSLSRPGHAYDIILKKGINKNLFAEIEQRMHAGSYIVVADDAVAELYSIPPSGTRRGNWGFIRMRAGEQNKNWKQMIPLCDKALAMGPDRDTVVVAVGGGVTGDMTGFCASCLLRGLRLVMVPTTLLSMVDSSVGGKNGIDTPYGKNLAGTFHQPSLVLIDPEYLDSLPRREYIAGLGEVLKSAIIDGEEFFDYLQTHSTKLMQNDHAALIEVIARCCRFKARIVMDDEQEKSGRRALLNLGHTFGHALEALAGYDGTVVHGEAVAVGTVLAARFAEEKKLGGNGASGELTSRIARLTTRLGLPAGIRQLGTDWKDENDSWAGKLAGDELVDALLSDKKTRGGLLTLVLPHAIGDCRPDKGFDAQTVAHFMRATL